MLQIDKNHILILISHYLDSIQQNKLAKKVKKALNLPYQSYHSPLFKKKLDKIIRHYVAANQKLLNHYLDQIQHEQNNQQEIIEAPKRKSESVEIEKQMTKKQKIGIVQVVEKKELTQKQKIRQNFFKAFTSPKLLQTSNIEKVEIVQINNEKQQKVIQQQQRQQQQAIQKIEKKKKKKSKKKQEKEQKIQEQIKQVSQQQQQVVVKKKKKEKKKSVHQIQQEQQIQQQSKSKQKTKLKIIQKQTENIIPSNGYSNHQNNQQSTHKPFYFSRINKQSIGPLSQQLMDNTFQAKFKFGKGDEWGKYGYERLKNTRGQGFKKQKGKLKSKAFQAGGIDINIVNSISLL